MRNVYFVLEESPEIYKGGISSLLDGYFKHSVQFASQGFNIVRVNPFAGKKTNNRFLNKVRNFCRLFTEKRRLIKKINNKDKDAIIHIHCGYGFVLFKNLLTCKFLKKKGFKNICLSIHFADINKIFLKNNFLRKKEEKLLKLYVDRIILLSKETIRSFIDIGFSDEQLKLIYPFHDYGKCEFENSRDFKTDQTTILFIGSIDKRKGVLDLLEAFKKTPKDKYRLLICGSKNDESVYSEFQNRVKTLNNVEFRGFVTGTDKEELLKQSDILVLPSYGEGLPVAILEAMHFGALIISTDVGAIPEILEDKKSCYFFKPGDIDSLTNILNNLSKDEAVKISRNGMSLSNDFICENNIDNLCSIYKEAFYEYKN